MRWFKIWLIFLICLPVFVSAHSFKIVGIQGAPLRFYDENQQLVGIDVDVIDTIMKKLEVPYEIEIVASSTRLKHLWQDPNVDMILTYSYKTERAQYLDYPVQSHVTLSWNFFLLKENLGKFDFDTFDDFKGLKIGATQGFSYTKAFWEAADSGVFTLDMVVKNELNMNKLLHGRFDTYANSRIDTLFQARQGGYLDKITFLQKPLKEKQYFNTFVKVSDYPYIESIKRRYDIELQKMRKEGVLQVIYDKYLGNQESYK